jgi:glucosamine-6-phosphate deaminase
MKLITCQSDKEFNETAASFVIRLLNERPDAVLGFATGSTPQDVYSHLAEAFYLGRVSFRQAAAFNLDEYVGLPAKHPQSYSFYMQQNLYRHIDIHAERVHIPDGSAPDPLLECERYNRLLEQTGQIDLQLLGLGHNGHIGFNEPADELHGRTHLVDLHPESRKANSRYFDSLSEVPKQAITMGVASILQAKTVLLMVRGADKAGILHRALHGPITTQCPASLLQTHPNLIVQLDSEAGRLYGEQDGQFDY